MNIINPYKVLDHRVYSRTFLHSIQVGLDFDLCNGALSNSQALKDFVYKFFQVTVNETPSSLSCIELCDEKNQVKFIFTENMAKVTVGAKSYKSFADTMIPFVMKLSAYMEQICKVPTINRLTIKKNNLWEIKADNDIITIYPSALQYTFNKRLVDDMASIKSSNNPPFKISKEVNTSLGDGTLNVVISSIVKNKKEADFTLDFTAAANNVDAVKIVEISTKLNDIIYCSFHDIVSKNVIKLMEQDGGK